jgi:4-hydroxythreonine-4-phosphate dehydrogenase
MTGWIAISLGDISGIGPEVTLKALAAESSADDTHYLLIGPEAGLAQLNQTLGLQLQWQRFSHAQSSGRIFVHTPAGKPAADGRSPASDRRMPAGSAPTARAALAALEDGAQRCLRGEVDALVTAPVNKEAIMRLGEPFMGQTEYLSQLARAEHTGMMLLGADERQRWLRVALVTTHLPLKEVAAKLTRGKVELAIELAAQACRDLGLPRARLGVCGLNPHAGEGGQLGDEEQTIIAPAVQAAQRAGFDVAGPFAADTLFYRAFHGSYDAVVAMYHDQGLVPLKMIGFETGVNWTLGLPFVRTSPDHGTAYDIAGKGVANPGSMIAALRLAKQLARQRSQALRSG